LECQQQTAKVFRECLEKHFNTTGTTLIEKEENKTLYEECSLKSAMKLNKCLHTNWEHRLLKQHINRTLPVRCDKHSIIYRLNKDSLSNLKAPMGCERPFALQKIAKSNLLLVLINNSCKMSSNQEFYDSPKTVMYSNNDSLTCRRMRNKLLFRKLPKLCFTQHENESKMEFYCGRSAQLSSNQIVSVLVSLVLLQM